MQLQVANNAVVFDGVNFKFAGEKKCLGESDT